MKPRWTRAGRIASGLLGLFLMGNAVAQSPEWTAAEREAAQAVLECRTLLSEKSLILRRVPLSPVPGNQKIRSGVARAPENLRVFGLPVSRVYFFRVSENTPDSFVAITEFQESVTWDQLVRAGRLKARQVMGEEAWTRKTAIGVLEAWREAPFWVELTQTEPDAAPRLYLSCGAGGETEVPIMILKPQAWLDAGSFPVPSSPLSVS